MPMTSQTMIQYDPESDLPSLLPLAQSRLKLLSSTVCSVAYLDESSSSSNACNLVVFRENKGLDGLSAK
jgi:hypothetical protein